ncbi:Rossmann-like and DUF2520 domain-containing protein [Peptostreptococcus equinus]|uniref:DUF2520 domain-containing protein n=1 Tax=Peptostreptococcus equinus TaxID=3003601 RepID=A0ABY7JSE9_9FIRM|nr:Rossmann-like and DUF2520 domain-containing protein [Peptostreptococcus sp. CBA3647]WAW14910.1 DUF2520 domain-containing protein [Peptostreptococcus sp. CBA3647]
MHKIGIIGAGKVGVSIGKSISEDENYKLVGFYSRTKESSNFAAKFTNSAKFINLEKLVEKCNILIITTPDDKISEMWSLVSQFNIQNKIICHCSGSLSSEIFFDISSKGAYGCSLHPMMAINSKDKSYKDLKNAFFTLEGEKNAIDVMQDILIKFNNNYKIIKTSDKTKYHMASVFVSNFVTGLANVSANLLKDYGFNEKEAINAFSFLARANIENLLSSDPKSALTGPIERNDIGIVRKHLISLNEKSLENVENIYRGLSIELVKIASEKHKDRDYKELTNLLKKGEVNY